MPGIETRAPERTDTSSGLVASPNLRADRLLDLRERVLDLRFELGRDSSYRWRRNGCRLRW